ncbi:MAG: hypothetical protein V4489_04055 [Chlamydiota bacterium]
METKNHMDLTWLKNFILKEIILTQHSECRWSVLASALDSLQQPVHSIAEIGVYQGVCSQFLRLYFPSANLYLIDPWEINTSYQSSDGPVTTTTSDMDGAFNQVKSYFQNDPYTHILKKLQKKLLS